MRRAVSAWAPVVGWIAVITALSTERFSDVHTAAWLAGAPLWASLGVPPAHIDTANFILRKSMHFVEYAVLALLTYRALGMGEMPRTRRARLLGAVLLGLSCAVFDEVHQAFTVTRSGRLHDVLLDAAGTVTGALVAARRGKHR